MSSSSIVSSSTAAATIGPATTRGDGIEPVTPISVVVPPVPSATTITKSQNYILSEKVMQTLQIPTDTPAMQAAWEALASLSSSSSSYDTSMGEGKQDDGITPPILLDAKSIRTAVEMDALQQALLFQNQLKLIMNQVQQMKGEILMIRDMSQQLLHILEPAAAASSLSRSFPEENSLPPPTKDDEQEKNHDASIPALTSIFEKEEQELAQNIAQAFLKRNQAQMYYETLYEFLNQYELTPEEGHLLDTFQLVPPSLEKADWTGLLQQGLQFIFVLDKIQHIRLQLMKRFEDPLSRSSSSSSSSSSSGMINPTIGVVHEEDIIMDATASSSTFETTVATSTLRMMKSLIQRQEYAFERLYQSLSTLLQQQQLQNHGGGDSTGDNSNSNSHVLPLEEEFYSHPFFHKALMILYTHVPTYYHHIVDLFAQTRRTIVTRNFLIALTTGSTSYHNHSTTTNTNISAPLERMAHDPVTYVGDMLAHVYQSLNDEKDLVQSCFMITNHNQDNEEEDDEEKDKSDVLLQDLEKDMYRVLNHIVGGVVRPLRGRILQLFESLTRRPTQDEENGNEEDDDFVEEDGDNEVNMAWMRDPMDPNSYISDSVHSSSIRRLASLYSICGLLIFYHEKMKNSLERIEDMKSSHGIAKVDHLGSIEESLNDQQQSLLRGIVDCLKEGVDSFTISLKVYTAIVERPPATPQIVSSLLPTKSHTRHVKELVHSLCVVNNTSPGFAIDLGNDMFSDDSALYLRNIGDWILGAALSSCELVDDVSALHSLVEELTLAGVPADRISSWKDNISVKERSLIDSLISSETLVVIDRVGLGDSVKALVQNPMHDENFAPHYTALSPQRLQSALTRFYTALHSPPIPTYEEQIKDIKLRKYARSMIADGVIEAYTRLYRYISSHSTDVQLQTYTPDQVKSLLAI